MIKKLVLSCFLFLCYTRADATTIYLKPDEALQLIFSTSQEITMESKTLSEDQMAIIKKKLGYSPQKKQWNFYLAKTGSRIDGYAIIDNEIGKTEPITFMTAITPQGKVKTVEILVYRESHGGEVHHKNFRKQFDGKDSKSPLIINKDIQNISGATLSSQAVTKGVKRALVLWEIFY